MIELGRVDKEIYRMRGPFCVRNAALKVVIVKVESACKRKVAVVLSPKRRNSRMREPAYLSQQSPDIAWMITHSRYVTDKPCHPGQGPQIRRVPLRPGPAPQFLLDQR